jgi:eukaryotic-like serine/threonine-protein kinase
MTPTSLIGRTLNRQYKITRLLGEGGFGSVYEAEEPRFNRKVAIKTIHPQHTEDPTTLERFRREGMAASRLDHPSAVKVFNLIEAEDGLVFMVMEFIEGKTLSDTIKERTLLSPQETQLLLQPICEVLEEAHAKGIVHRDLKPKNIMLTPTAGGFFAKVLDFGISHIASEKHLTHLSQTLGTPAYMAPEQWQPTHPISARTDLYALALISYKCLSGKLLFEANTSHEWMKQHCIAAPTPLSQIAPHLPKKLSDVVMRSLSKQPDDRHASPMDFYLDFCDALESHSNDTIQAPNDTSDTIFEPKRSLLIIKPEKLSLPTLLNGDAEDPALKEALQQNTNEEGQHLVNKLLEQHAPMKAVHVDEPAPKASELLSRRNLGLGAALFILLVLAYLMGRASSQ